MLPTDPSRVWPFWLERQTDPTSPDFVPGDDRAPRNVTHRNATPIGTIASASRALVDPRGLVTPDHGRWSVDWWIGAEDRWHVPARARTVRQRLLDGAPVVETALRAPGGDVQHRAYAVHDTTLGPCAVIEIENRTSVPVAVALAIRPYTPLGTTSVQQIDIDDAVVRVEGQPALLFPKAPAHVLLADGSTGDVAGELIGASPGAIPALGGSGRSAWDADGQATAAFVSPLAHTSVLRVVIPLAERAVPTRLGRLRGGDREPQLRYPEQVASGEQVAKGWRTQTGRGTRLDLPDDRLQLAIDAAAAQLLLVAAGEDLASWPDPLDLDEMQPVLGALDEFGFADEVEQVLRSLDDRQALDGAFGASGRQDANAAALAAVARHWHLTRDTDTVERLVGALAKAAHWIEKRRTSRRAARAGNAAGLLPTGPGPVDGAGPGTYLRDSARSARALDDVADAFEAAGQPEVAADCRSFAALLGSALKTTIAAIAPDGPVPAVPDRPIDASVVANLELVAPFGSVGVDHAATAATLDHVRRHLTVGPAVLEAAGHRGLSPVRTAQLATLEVELGDRRALERLEWLIDIGGTSGVWPSVVHPRTLGGAARRPADPVALASFLTLVRRLVVRETGGDGLALLSLVPTTWYGQPIDVRDAPTALGRVSFSIRWHGERPALLWEIEPHPGVTSVRLTAPGLDPDWFSTELSGEALLAAPAPLPPEPEPQPADAGDEGASDAGAPSPTIGLGAPPTPATESPVFLRPPRPAGDDPADGSFS